MEREYTLSSESVSEGHPDKIADQISDAVVDAFLTRDAEARVACETMVTRGVVYIAGEVTSNASVEIPWLAREVIRTIGYTDSSLGFDWRSCAISVSVNQQVPDIGTCLGGSLSDRAGDCPVHHSLGADDHVIAFGHATDETPECMPLGLILAHRIMEQQAQLRKDGSLPWARPDAKAQVTVRYVNDAPVTIDSVSISIQHCPGLERAVIERDVMEMIIKPVIPERLRTKGTEYMINSAGNFVIGGPVFDTGLTGRKIMVDTYGGACPHGGGAFSGKDPMKTDRLAAYVARYIAKNIVAAGLARRCTIQLSYTMGRPHPVSLMINLHGTGIVEEQELEHIVPRVFSLTPMGIVDMLDLRRPIYRQTAVYGHFGRQLPDFRWERTDMMAILLHYMGVKGGNCNDHTCQGSYGHLHSC